MVDTLMHYPETQTLDHGLPGLFHRRLLLMVLNHTGTLLGPREYQ